MKYRVVLLKCACQMAFFKMCLADNLQDAADCGGLSEGLQCLKLDLSYIVKTFRHKNFMTKHFLFQYIFTVRSDRGTY